VSCTAGRYTSKLKLFGCLLNPSYRDPEATAAAFRNGFFLTGDLGWMDADGYLWFVARKKDVIRRRGENISGAEIDLVAGDHPEVVEAAAIGVPAELGEDEVLLAVVKKTGSTLTEHATKDLAAQGAKRSALRRRAVPLARPLSVRYGESPLLSERSSRRSANSGRREGRNALRLLRPTSCVVIADEARSDGPNRANR